MVLKDALGLHHLLDSEDEKTLLKSVADHKPEGGEDHAESNEEVKGVQGLFLGHVLHIEVKALSGNLVVGLVMVLVVRWFSVVVYWLLWNRNWLWSWHWLEVRSCKVEMLERWEDWELIILVSPVNIKSLEEIIVFKWLKNWNLSEISLHPKLIWIKGQLHESRVSLLHEFIFLSDELTCDISNKVFSNN